MSIKFILDYMGLFIKNRLTILSILLIISRVNTFSQPCETNFTLQPVQGNNSIEWDKFPQFTLPFTIIYNGPRFGDQNSRPLQHGFSHIAYFSGPENSTLPVKNRALLWNSVASVEVFQPWSVVGLESPWGNDTAIYRRHWDRYITDMANLFDDSRLSGIPRADIICLDVERMQELDRDILNLKRDNRIPEGYRSLADNTFMTTYKKDIRWWYTAPVNYLKNKGLPETTKLSSYSDVPVRGTWLNVTTNSWADWTSNTQRTHYLMQDDAGKIGGSFYNAMDILMPSAYYYYPYENPLGKDYLSYLLFQIEVNKAWSSKDIIPFVWLRYHDSFVPGAPQIPKFMAEATAIFPFFSGAKGLWLWDNNMFENTQQQNYSTYEHFIYGLYRLSQFSDMFQGNYELVIPQSARDHMQQRNPIWRGVVKDGKIVIAAQNTYAAENQNTELTVTYKQWTKTITLTGRDVFLCKFDLSDVVSALDSSLQVANVYPNPTDQKSVFVNLSSRSTHSNLTFELLDLKGVVLRTTQMPTQIGDIRYQFDLPIVPEGLYMLRISSENSSTSHSIFIKN